MKPNSNRSPLSTPPSANETYAPDMTRGRTAQDGETHNQWIGAWLNAGLMNLERIPRAKPRMGKDRGRRTDKTRRRSR